jgi:SAM-dependent methyltransferase
VFGIPGRHEVGNAEALPFPDASFDHVYSFGVIHHSPNTEAIVREIYRVLRPGGTFTVMVYNKTSINYYVEIMGLRRAFRLLLRPAFMPTVLARLTGLPEWKLQGHREIMLRNPHMTHEQWVSANTDGPDCPLAKVYSRADVLRLFGAFQDVRTGVYLFDRAHWPFIGRRLPESVVQWLGRRWGWHRMVAGQKPRA